MDSSVSDVMLAVHVIAAAAWILVVAVIEVAGTRARNSGDADAAVDFAARAGRRSRMFALPGSLLVLLSGGWLMHDAGLSISHAWWLGTGIGAWFVAFLGSTMLRGPECARIPKLAAEHGSDDEDVQWRIRRVLLLGRGELLLLVVALSAMLVQPTS